MHCLDDQDDEVLMIDQGVLPDNMPELCQISRKHGERCLEICNYTVNQLNQICETIVLEDLHT